MWSVAPCWLVYSCQSILHNTPGDVIFSFLCCYVWTNYRIPEGWKQERCGGTNSGPYIAVDGLEGNTKSLSQGSWFSCRHSYRVPVPILWVLQTLPLIRQSNAVQRVLLSGINKSTVFDRSPRQHALQCVRNPRSDIWPQELWLR